MKLNELFKTKHGNFHDSGDYVVCKASDKMGTVLKQLEGNRYTVRFKDGSVKEYGYDDLRPATKADIEKYHAAR